MAAQNGHKEVLNLLLAMGADVNGATPLGTPLYGACYNGHASIISVLLAKGANAETPNPTNGFTPLRRAAVVGHVEAVKALLRGGARVTGKTIAALTTDPKSPVLDELVLHALAAGGALRDDIRAALQSLQTSAN